MALERSNVNPSEIRYVNAHATSTPVGDNAEISAVKRLFKDVSLNQSEKVYLSSVKGSVGHLLGAAGAVESIFTVLTCKERVLPPAINIQNIDPNLKLDEAPYLKIVVNKPISLTEIDVNKRFVALKNSFGFGGTNASIVFSSFTNN